MRMRITKFIFAVPVLVSFGFAAAWAAPAPDECTNWQATQPTWIFCDGYESGTSIPPTPWSQIQGPVNTHVTTANPYSGSYSMAIHYNKIYDPTNSADQNLFSELDIPNNQQDHVFIRGYVYLGQPLAGTEGIQRKLYYLKDPNFGTVRPSWSVVLVCRGFTVVVFASPPADSVFLAGDNIDSNNPRWATTPVPDPNGFAGGYTLVPDRWYNVQLEVQANTPGRHDGVLSFWIDGVEIAHKATANLRGNLTTGLSGFGVGYQADDSTNQPVNGMRYDEMRYWDNIVISKGPPRPATPNPPSVGTSPSAPAITAYPNPWRADRHAGTGMTFNNLRTGSTLKIFTLSGHKAAEITASGTSATWNLLNTSGKAAASGLYVYTATDQAGQSARGKVAIIR